MKKLLVLTIAALLLVGPAMAKQRTEQEIRTAALSVLNNTNLGIRRAPGQTMTQLSATADYQIYGYKSGGYVIVTTDDMFPAVIGYSDKSFSTANADGFLWYLSAASKAMETMKFEGVKRTAIKPDPMKYAPQMPALVSAQWGQEEPYNNLCPYGPDLYGTVGRACTGCVATAMAQILYYHRGPLHAQGGTHSVCYPENNPSNVFSIDFDKSTYDYGNMLDVYKNVDYSEAQANAVAKLMVDCGVAADMKYGVSFSGAYTENAVEGLKRNFGINTARIAARENYKLDDAGWMDLVFNEVSNRRPILYTGIDLSDNGGGHAFVLDGYDENGLVHINWGWNGEANGFYDISLLNPQHNNNKYSFSEEQDMIIGISLSSSADALSDTINVSTPGTLASLINADKKYSYTSLKVNGNINGSDLLVLRDLAGRDQQGRSTRGGVSKLDISGARFVAGGEPYYKENGVEYTTSDDELPAKAFYRCDRLTQILLPKNLKTVGDAPFALCSSLDSVSLPAADGQQFMVDNGVVYSSDGKQVITCLPYVSGAMKIAKGVENIHDAAFAGCTRLSSVVLPSSLRTIGKNGFYYCHALSEIRSYAVEPPTVGDDAFYGIDTTVTKLFVRHNCSQAYKTANVWKSFFSTPGVASEFGALIKGGTNIRKYGEENPTKFRYTTTIYGTFSFTGEPAATCEATRYSAPGRYPVKFSAGTIDDEAVEFKDGVLIVQATPTDIENVETSTSENKANVLFNLSGQRVGKDYKGIVVEKGKKYIKK